MGKIGSKKWMKILLLCFWFSLTVPSLSWGQKKTQEVKPKAVISQIIAASGNFIYVKNEDFYNWNEYNRNWVRVGSAPIPQGKKISEIKVYNIDDGGNLWLLTHRNILKYDCLRKKWISFPLSEYLQSLARSIFLLQSLEIWNRSIWLSGPDYIWRYDIRKKFWKKLDYPEKVGSGILKKGPKHSLWINGIARYDGESWHTLPSFPDFGWSEKFHSFTWDEEDQPWVVTSKGIYYYNYTKKTWHEAVSGMFVNQSASIESFQGSMWVTEYGLGLYKIDGESFEKIELSKPRPSLAYSKQLFTTSSHLWINTYFGVGSYDGEKWLSHFDYTDHEKLNELFLYTITAVIGLLMFGFFSLILIRRFSVQRF